MRPRIVDFLTDFFDTHYINYFVPTGGVIYVATISVIAWLFIYRCKNAGLPRNFAWGAILFGIFGAIVWARLLYLVLHIGNTIEHPDLILRYGGGTVSWGAYFGGLAAFLLYLRKEKMYVLNYLDVLASVLGMAPFIGRWACFLNGCCYGTPTNLPWGIQFPQNSFAYNAQFRVGLIDSQAVLSLSVHPVQIYASIVAIVIFFIMSNFWKKYSKFPGMTFLFYWLIYGLLRFFIEFLRGDGSRYTVFNLTLSQIIILLILPIIFFMLVRLYENKKGMI